MPPPACSKCGHESAFCQMYREVFTLVAGLERADMYYCCGGIHVGWTARSVAAVGGLTGLPVSLQKAFESILIEGTLGRAFARAELEELSIHCTCLEEARRVFKKESSVFNRK